MDAADPAPVFTTVDPSTVQARHALRSYFTELDERFTGGFDVAGAMADDGASLRPPTGAFVVALDGDDAVACGGVTRLDDRTWEIKRMWVDPTRRGAGLASGLLAHLESLAIAEADGRSGCRIVLDTNDVLATAIALYDRSGYERIERYNDNPYARLWFAKAITAS